ncbi:hypothetical protein N0V88_003523 [Collariella sp. IMI 366227]|nr:hypothetical protein N0V88_003523 [Collariella sp. IMI 366227]
MLLGNSPFPTGYEGNDNMGSEDTLAHLTVKGITNLASFPNPMQKAARDALARARTTNVSLDRSDTPLSVMSTNVDFTKDRVSGSYGAIPVPGPPRPLTAGPPGQRQFKPMTGENTSKGPGAENLASQMLSNTSSYQSITPIGPPPTIGSNVLAGFNGDDIFPSTGQPVRPSLEHGYHEPVLHHLPEFKEFRRTPGPPESNTERTRRKVHDTLPPDAVKQYFPRGFPSNYDGRHQPMADDWPSNYPAVEGMRGQKPFSEQLNSINRSFYAGTEGLVRNMEQIVRDHNYRCLENKVGVIGEERQRLRGSHIERLGADGKVQPPPLTVAEVEGMDEDEVTKPLINMAYASLLRYKEEGQSAPSSSWSGGFIPAEDDWVDGTEEGNSSFFSSPKEEQLKKRRIPRRARRGY